MKLSCHLHFALVSSMTLVFFMAKTGNVEQLGIAGSSIEIIVFWLFLVSSSSFSIFARLLSTKPAAVIIPLSFSKFLQ
jgi:hypothetical protein